LLEQYQQLHKQQVLCEDKAQYEAVVALDKLSKATVTHSNKSNRQNTSQNPTSQSLVTEVNSTCKGLYLHGRVGRGKTMLMDMFYKNIPIESKRRLHFHRFMESVHQQLNELSVQQSSANACKGINPLERIAKSWAMNIELLCLDEFFVSDIGDAMLLAGLFKALFSFDVIVVLTSNFPPEKLYLNGLQRDRFLPTITLINQYCQVISVDGEHDHRLTNVTTNHYNNYYLTHFQGNQQVAQRFKKLSNEEGITFNHKPSANIVINHREIPYIAKTHRHIWFDFFDLCAGPRSQRDYIKLADQFETVLISNVPQFSGKHIPAVFSGVEDSYQRSGVLMPELRQLDNEARRFMALVDEFYDRKIALIISADVDIMSLYQGQQLSFEFQRCQSRLFEMQNN
jgi:cell division protein ZapE